MTQPPKRWTIRIDGVVLPGPNALMRMHAQPYRRLRDELLLLARSTLDPALPSEPLTRCSVDVTMVRPKRNLLDVDAKFGAIKPLLDVLQPGRRYARTIAGRQVLDVTPGLGLIADDSDGQGELPGCVVSLGVVQTIGAARIDVEIVDRRDR